MLHTLGKKIIRGLKFWFGDFTKDELIKFGMLGLVFTLIIGTYWTLRPLKDIILPQMLGKDAIPTAKVFSLLFVFPIVIAYSKIVDLFPRQKLFYAICSLYCVLTLAFSLMLTSSSFGFASAIDVAQRTGTAAFMSKFLAYGFYVFVESFGSIVVTLFWGFITDITLPDAARYGFPLVALLGQVGGILMPKYLTKLPRYIKESGMNVPSFFTTNLLTIAAAGLAMMLIVLVVAIFVRVVPKSQLVGFHEEKKNTSHKKGEESEPGFMEGLKLMLSQPYLLGIFGVILFYEVIVTIFDFNFKGLATTQIIDPVARAEFLGAYAEKVNTITFFCLLFGINNIQRFLGITTSLALMPILVGGAVFAFFYYPDNLQFLFWLMVSAKAVNYALNSPSMKQLYVPTSKEVRYKSQAWIESFGSRGAKGAGSGINMLQGKMQVMYGEVAGFLRHVQITTVLSMAMVAGWFFVAIYLGKTQENAVKKNKVVC